MAPGGGDEATLQWVWNKVKLWKTDSGFEVNFGGLFIWYFIQVEVEIISHIHHNQENGRDFNF